MQVSVEVLEGLQRKLTIQVPSSDIQGEVERRLRDLSRRVRLDGFRPGKIPMKVVKRRFGDSVLNEVTHEIIEKSFVDAVSQEQLRPAGGPHIHGDRPKVGEDYRYEATFEIYPEVALQGVETLTVQRPIAEVADSDVEAMLQRLRRQRQTWHRVERPGAPGDRVIIDFRGVLEGESEPFPGGSGEGMPVVLGAGGLIPGFEEALRGASAGDERHFTVTFPAEYQAQALAGKVASFEVKVHAVEAAQLPELDAEFARAFGIEEGDLDKLRSELRANLERELAQAARREIKAQVMQGLHQANQFELPQVLVKEEIRAMAIQRGAMAADADRSATVPEELRDRLQPDAERRVALGLLVAEIVRRNDLKPDARLIELELERVASSYERPDEVKQWYRQNQRAMESVRAVVLEDQVVDWVLERCRVEDKPRTFAEITGGPQATVSASAGEPT